jgi:hypothetical protein
MIIGISGKIGSGKDTIGKIIQYLISNEYNKMSYSSFCLIEERWYNSNYWQIKKFAGKLKQIVSILTGISVEDLEKEDVKNSQLPDYWHKFDENNHYLEPDTVREILQKVGTECMRNNLHSNVWVNALFSDYKIRYINQATGKETLIGNYEYYKNGLDTKAEIVTKEEPNWVITDMRFPNELKAVKDRNGITIRVNRYDLIYTTENRHISELALDKAEFDYIINNDSTIEDLIKQVKEILIKENIIT